MHGARRERNEAAPEGSSVMLDPSVILSLSKEKGDFVVSTARSSGKGGQNVNKRDTKVRVVHPASGAMGVAQEHRTQERNKAAAFRRCVESKEFKQWLHLELVRRGFRLQTNAAPLGPTGARGSHIRTYNYPRGTVVDHRTGTVGVLADTLDGDVEGFLAEVRAGMIERSLP